MSAYEGFVAVHKYQLASIPEELWQPLFMKLGEDYLDAGNFVELHQGDIVPGYSVHTKKDVTLKKHSDIFLIDHAWTTTPKEAKQQLRDNETLLDRMESIMDIEKEELADDEEEDEVEHDDEVVKMVAEQADVSYGEAKKALEEENYEVLNAIMKLTMDEEHKKEADRLQEQVINQILASGRPQEKEEEERKEKEEAHKKRLEELLERRVERVYCQMWSYLQTYSFSVLQQDGEPKAQTAWYACDEVGSALCHSSDPSVVCVPFIFSRGASGMIPYSVMFPIKDIKAGEPLTCDLLPKNLERPIDRKAYLLAFQQRLLADEDVQKITKELVDSYKAYQTSLEATQPPKSSKITNSEESVKALLSHPAEKAKEPVKVASTTPFVCDNLKLANTKLVTDEDKADIIWRSQDFMEWDSLKEHQTINQFPNEFCLTFKQNLAALIQKTYGSPEWVPRTYNLVTQLGEVVGNYLNNEESKSDNLWILKPWNLARGIDISINRSLPELIRTHDSAVPMIAQKYLTKPCLYNGKKFDLRYIVLLRQIEPTMIACVYNMFWIRLANKKFNLDDLDDYERQFTVMNYSKYEMTQLDYKSFIYHMEKENNIKWADVQNDINQAMKGNYKEYFFFCFYLEQIVRKVKHLFNKKKHFIKS
ncbi:tubulin-tyrosine ligase family-domain-containing protein [Phycomyces blakesleeanus]